MPSILNETLEWLDRGEQAREVAGQLNDPGARKAVLELAESFDLVLADARRLTANAWATPVGAELDRQSRQSGHLAARFANREMNTSTSPPVASRCSSVNR